MANTTRDHDSYAPKSEGSTTRRRVIKVLGTAAAAVAVPVIAYASSKPNAAPAQIGTVQVEQNQLHSGQTLDFETQHDGLPQPADQPPAHQ